MNIPVALLRSCTFILAYFVCWQFSAFLEVAPSTSIFYPACGVLAFFCYRWGWQYIPVAAVAIQLGCLPQIPFSDLDAFLLLQTLRQFAVYGGLAVLARKYWKLTLPLETLHDTIRLLAFAFVSSLLSAALAMLNFSIYRPALHDILGSVALSFWMGDFSGFLIFFGGVSVVLALKPNFQRRRKAFRLSEFSPKAIGLVATLGTVVVLMAFLRAHFELHSYSYLILLPVIFGAIVFGLHFAIASAILTNVTAVTTYLLLDSTSQVSLIQFQMLCAVVMCVAMVLGGAISDRTLARFDAWHDQMTGMLNRRAFFEQGELMLARAKRYHYRLALIMLDLDYFKLVNDTYGHDAGDRLLCEVADHCKGITRAGDLCARIGGEEFVLLIEHSDANQATQIAERLRAMIYQLKRGTSQDPASASFGISVSQTGNETLSDLLASADRMLYVAKQTGRNRVVLDSQMSPVSA